MQPGPSSSSRLEMAAKRRPHAQNAFGKKWHMDFYQVYQNLSDTISPRNLDETLKIMWGSETTFQDL